MNLLSTLVLIPLIIPYLDCMNHLEEATEGPDGADGICYEEPDLSGGVEGGRLSDRVWNRGGSRRRTSLSTKVVVVIEQYKLYSI
jgi:hypothetical protein